MLAALASYLDARAADGEWLLRIEDIDPPREQPGASAAILKTLDALGLHWDGQVQYQSQRLERYRDTAAELRTNGAAFFCQCTRQALRTVNLAADRPSGFYPGTCRDRQLDSGALRVRVDATEMTVTDRLQAPLTGALTESVGDFIIVRRDALPAYQLAVVVDDAAQHVTDVVRGYDLYDSTPRQQWLQHVLGVATPRYAHIPILLGTDGDKLSKQTGAMPIEPGNASTTLCNALIMLQQSPPEDLRSEPVEAVLAWATEHWQPTKLSGVRTLASPSVAAQQNPLRFGLD